jgi:DNA invertase Pin-like site-specific DNA recombinase
VRKKPKSKYAIIYTRFSPRRHANTCESLDTQFEICTSYCKIHDMTVLGNYEDAALSGSNVIDRMGLRDALAHVLRIKAVLVFYSLSRLARSTRDALQIVEAIDDGGAGLCSVKESLDTTSPMGKCIFTIMSAFNELDRNQTAMYTQDAMRRHQNSGRRMSHILPYGWRSDPDDDARMLPDDYEREVIEVIADLRLPGFDDETGEELARLSLREIAAELTEKGYIPRRIQKEIKGIKTSIAGKWSFGHIRNILKRQGQDRF